MAELFDILDLALILGVSLQTTLLAFVHSPGWKAFLYSFPIPFTLANLSLGEPVSVTHAAGMLNLILYLNMVRWLHKGLRMHIVPAIALSAGLYIAVGAGLKVLLPDSGLVFWITVGASAAVAVVLLFALPHRDEEGHRSELPVPVKAAAVTGVIVVIVALKRILGGFMTTFPMVGVVGAYESRKSLWTLARQGPVLVLSLVAMMTIMRLLQAYAGWSVALSLTAGWFGWLAVSVPVTLTRLRRQKRTSSHFSSS